MSKYFLDFSQNYFRIGMPWWYFGAWQHVWNRVLWVQWYISGQSKTIRIAVPVVMGGFGWA
uniref:Uncharacterized protein n=1 Tax=Oryza sativa subsp. japonica TaxID=39947 RepID=Q60DQ7_ORYSJ|nr:unknown protein [Oryza sativa Japonica Group]